MNQKFGVVFFFAPFFNFILCVTIFFVHFFSTVVFCAILSIFESTGFKMRSFALILKAVCWRNLRATNYCTQTNTNILQL